MRSFLVAFLLCATALAGPSKSDRKLAEAHFKQGQAYFNTSQWKDAIDEYEKAWALDPEPVLQFNEALAYEKAGDVETALARYQKYLELDPSGPVADEASEDIARLKPQVDAIVAAREKAAADAKAKADADAKAKADAEAKAAADAKAKADADAKAKAEAWAAEQRAKEAAAERARAAQVAARDRTIRRGKLLSWGGIGAGVLGVVGVAVGVKYGLDARAASDALSANTSDPWTDALLARQAEGRADDRNLKIFTIAGGVTAIAGAALWYVGHRTTRHGEAMTVTVSAGAGAVGVAGSF